mmetsp:Transcript_23295/g.26822  ORF Transcript_23295/g.26822 Transcript_23295/m.26822 type:complete len:253 (-) Transcript_23295:534-1292(-)
MSPSSSTSSPKSVLGSVLWFDGPQSESEDGTSDKGFVRLLMLPVLTLKRCFFFFDLTSFDALATMLAPRLLRRTSLFARSPEVKVVGGKKIIFSSKSSLSNSFEKLRVLIQSMLSIIDFSIICDTEQVELAWSATQFCSSRALFLRSISTWSSFFKLFNSLSRRIFLSSSRLSLYSQAFSFSSRKRASSFILSSRASFWNIKDSSLSDISFRKRDSTPTWRSAAFSLSIVVSSDLVIREFLSDVIWQSELVN